MLFRSATDIWERVQTGEPPAVDMDGVLLRLLDSLYPNRSGEKAVDGPEAARLLLAYEHASDAVKAAETAKQAAKAAVVNILGDKEILTVGGDPIFTYRAQDKRSLSLTALENDDVALYLQVLEGGHINTTTSRVLRATRRKADPNE